METFKYSGMCTFEGMMRVEEITADKEGLLFLKEQNMVDNVVHTTFKRVDNDADFMKAVRLDMMGRGNGELGKVWLRTGPVELGNCYPLDMLFAIKEIREQRLDYPAPPCTWIKRKRRVVLELVGIV